MYSLEHKKYLKKQKIKNIYIKIIQISILIIIITIWQILTNKNIINPFIFSSPKNIIKCLINLHKTNNLYIHIWTTLYETILSFTLSTIIGIAIATLMWSKESIAKILDPYLTLLNSLPKVALGPIIIIWFGANMNSIIVMALLISVIITIINIYQGFINVDKNQITLMKSFKAKKIQILTKLIIPANYSTIINTLKINISMSLIGVIMGELLVSKKGLGYLIMYGSQVFNLNIVMTSIIILCIFSIVLYYIITIIEHIIIKNK